MKKAAVLFILLLSSEIIFAQDKVTILDSLNFYGSIRAHVAVFDSNLQVQNNSSRIGFYIDRKIVGGIVGFAQVEEGINLVSNNESFNPDAAVNPDEAFFTETQAAFSTRLGFIGIKTKYGSLSIGKQWGVYYDVSAWTDNFWVFGGIASGTYNTKNDGGTEGTGRAEDALQYRYSAKRFSVGLQTQFIGRTENYAASLVGNITDQLSIGAAFNTYDVPADIRAIVGDEIDHANSFVAGIRYSNKKLYAAFVYDYNQSETQYPGDTVVAFPANGIELLVHWYVLPKLRLEGGINYLKPTSTPEIISSKFNLNRIIIGAAYYFLPDFFAYTEYNIDEGTNTSGNKPSNVFTIGFRYNFSFEKSQIRF